MLKKDKEDFLGLEDACPSVFFSGKSIFCMRKTEVSLTVSPLKANVSIFIPPTASSWERAKHRGWKDCRSTA